MTVDSCVGQKQLAVQSVKDEPASMLVSVGNGLLIRSADNTSNILDSIVRPLPVIVRTGEEEFYQAQCQ